MDEFLKASKDFLTRDFAYVLGGGSVIASILWTYDPPSLPHSSDIPLEIYLFIAGLSYIIGYLVQEAFSLSGTITTAWITALPFPRIMEPLYTRFTGEIWQTCGHREDLRRGFENLAKENDRVWADYQRIISFKNVSATTAANGSVCSIILLTNVLKTCAMFDVVLLVGALFLSIAACVMTWIKAGQQAQTLWRYSLEGNENDRAQQNAPDQE
jgi:hypothetical protein